MGGVPITIESSFGDSTTTIYDDFSQTSGDSITYRIAAINAVGQGMLSNLPPTIIAP